jgi:hypothetical protein
MDTEVLLEMKLIDGVERHYNNVKDFKIEYVGTLLSFKDNEKTYYIPTCNIVWFRTEKV